MYTRLLSNAACLCFPSTGVKGMHLFYFLNLIFIYVYVCVCHMSAVPVEDRKGRQDPLELELQAVEGRHAGSKN